MNVITNVERCKRCDKETSDMYDLSTSTHVYRICWECFKNWIEVRDECIEDYIIHELKSISSPQRYSNIEWESLRVRINLYKQIKEQLLSQMQLYHTQRKAELVKLISESI